jgi:hypothetical protein
MSTRPETTRRTIEPAQQTAAKVAGFTYLFALLVFKSGFLPRILGVLLIAACFGYLADSLTPLLLPSYANLVGRIANIPLTLGEPAIILWLLIRGAKDQPLQAAA